jgi:shikimate kinase/3-dehydroquinate synthase
MINFRPIILIGFSGTGKTAVGHRVSSILGWKLVDIDALIVESEGKSIDQIFRGEGEERFREIEREAVTAAVTDHNVVISTGGGAVTDDSIRTMLLQSGFVVCLEAQSKTIDRRLRPGPDTDSPSPEIRPLLAGTNIEAFERIQALKKERQWSYSGAHWTIATDLLSIEQTSQEVLRAWRRLTPLLARKENDGPVAAIVTTDSGSYPIIVGWDFLEADLGKKLLETGFEGRAFIVCDSNVVHPYGRISQLSLHKAGIESHLFIFPAGEENKSLVTATAVFEWLAERRAERGDTIVAVGGGVAGDLAGLVSAMYARGMNLVHVPTSLTAMVDSSIGGKTAVDLSAGKNLIGAFQQPILVMTDVSNLATLPERALREGWAEAIKHGFALDQGLVEFYEEHADGLLSLDPGLMTQAIGRNITIKARLVTEDERETSGRRALLNYGHTIGHALETAAGYDRYLHGEAVAIGMSGAAMLGTLQGITPIDIVSRQRELLLKFGLPTGFSNVSSSAILEAMTRDKKRSAGEARWILLEDVGRSGVYRGISDQNVHKVLDALIEDS